MLTVKFNGNLGNKLFQLWSLVGVAKELKHNVAFPASEIYDYFDGSFTVHTVPLDLEYKEPAFNFTPVEIDTVEGATLNGYFQSERYWSRCEKELRKMFTFKKTFVNETKDKLPGLFNKEVICISIRRGDFVGNKTYYQLPITYYLGALLTEFPDFQTKYNLLVLSDDPDYCKAHFDCLDNVYYGADLNAFEQLCLGSLAQYHIISNSTFSWWTAYLSKSKKVIRPKHNFGEEYRKTHPEHDYWPEWKNWQVFDHEVYKIPLKDTTFMIPVFFDHSDRKANLDLTVCMLQRDFDTNVSVMENNGTKFAYMKQWTEYESVSNPYFHRTRMLNEMAVKASTPYIVNWDADVIVPPLQVYLSIQLLRNDYANFAYPYDGRFVRVLRKPFFKQVSMGLDIGVLKNADNFQFGPIKGKIMATSSVGGAVAMQRECFIASGMENENMISYAPEDCERWDRWHKLGYVVVRVPGKLYHMDHFCGPNSCSKNPFFNKNHDELDQLRGMTAIELRKRVDSWPWRAKALPVADSTD
jgi:hypothetical protein